MKSLTHLLKTKGKFSSFKRVLTLFMRYKFSSSLMHKNIYDMIKVCNNYGVKPTFPIPGKVFQKNRSFFEKFDESQCEYIIHGLYHRDYSKLVKSEQVRHLEESLNIFAQSNHSPKGFRAPYLSINNKTILALKDCGIQYDSSLTYHVKDNDFKFNANCHRIIKYYNSRELNFQPLPFIEEGIVRIPVILPDDEMIIDRMNIKESNKIINIWIKIFKKIKTLNGLFVLQLHPERYHFVKDHFNNLLDQIDSDVWVASLGEICAWCQSKDSKNIWPAKFKSAFAVTGDIDIISLNDLRVSR